MKNRRIPDKIELYSDPTITIRSLIDMLVNVLKDHDIDDATVQTKVIVDDYGTPEEVSLYFHPITIPKCNDSGH